VHATDGSFTWHPTTEDIAAFPAINDTLEDVGMVHELSFEWPLDVVQCVLLRRGLGGIDWLSAWEFANYLRAEDEQRRIIADRAADAIPERVLEYALRTTDRALMKVGCYMLNRWGSCESLALSTIVWVSELSAFDAYTLSCTPLLASRHCTAIMCIAICSAQTKADATVYEEYFARALKEHLKYRCISDTFCVRPEVTSRPVIMKMVRGELERHAFVHSSGRVFEKTMATFDAMI